MPVRSSELSSPSVDLRTIMNSGEGVGRVWVWVCVWGGIGGDGCAWWSS